MSFQAVIFDTNLFQRVANHIIEERKFAVYRAKLKYLLFLRKEEKAIKLMEEEKERREDRLKKIHKYRKEKQYLVSAVKEKQPEPEEPIVLSSVSEQKTKQKKVR